MQLPDVEHLKAILAACRETGATSLKLVSAGQTGKPEELHVQFGQPALDGAALVRAIDGASPVDPLAEIQRQVRQQGGRVDIRSAEDALDVLAAGGRLTRDGDNPVGA